MSRAAASGAQVPRGDSGSRESANELSGSAGGHVVQAGSIHGGVYIGAVPGPALPRPRQLPPAPVHFVDRTEPAAVIAGLAAEAADSGSCRLAAICGPGGTGKTALAVHCLHQAGALFPGGLLFAGLAAFGPHPADPEVVRGRWLRALGAQAPADPDEAAALWWSLTAERPVAVLLDDAAAPAQVRALLPGAGLAVVTSRRQMHGLAAGEDALLIRLGLLDSPAAAELARRIAARPLAAPGELENLARLCGLLPLTIRAAAARLAARPRLPVTQVTAELAASRDRPYLLDDQEGRIRAVMDTSYEALDPRAARAYRILALHPGPDFTAPAAAALLDAGTAEAEELIDALAGASLLEETAPNRWAYHDLTRDHARHQADAAESAGDRTAAMARAIDWYLRAAAAADLMVLPDRMRTAPAFALPRQRPPAYPGPAEALAWFDAEAANLMAAQTLAVSLGMHTLAWQYVDVMWGWLGHHQVYAAWRGICEEAMTAARACGDARAESWAGSRLACYYVSSGDPAAAIPVADAAIRTAYRAGDRAGEASAQEQRGNAALATGDHDEAIRCYQRGLDCWERITLHTRAKAILHRQLGRAHAEAGDLRQAEEHLMTAQAMFGDLGETYHKARTLYALAGVRLDTGQPAEAAALLHQAQPLMEQVSHVLSLSELLTRLAQASIATGDAGQARACLDRAAELQQSLGLPGSHPARVWTSRIASQLAGGS